MAARAVAVFANLLPMQAWFAPSASVFYYIFINLQAYSSLQSTTNMHTSQSYENCLYFAN